MKDKEFQEVVDMGLISKKGNKFKLTKRGKRYVETHFPRTIKRSGFGKMSVGEFIASSEEEHLEKELEKAVKDGLLVKFRGEDGRWFYQNAKKYKNK